MSKVVPTTTITIDGNVFEVEKMSDEVKAMISHFDRWREREFDASSELLLVQAALKHLQNELVQTISKEREAAVKAAEALGLLPKAPQAPTEIDVEKFLNESKTPEGE